jgi:hypothetical protein
MLYLFNSAVEAQAKKPDIFLTSKGEPVLALYLSHEFAGVRDVDGLDIPATRRLVGSFDNQSIADHQLTKGGVLTLLGLEYCNVMGVQKNYESMILKEDVYFIKGAYDFLNKLLEMNKKFITSEVFTHLNVFIVDSGGVRVDECNKLLFGCMELSMELYLLI